MYVCKHAGKHGLTVHARAPEPAAPAASR